ncbi:hypothetical protein [Rhodophyticola porphyridii]|nr:hypothetical protein [Rhodophyticola porphyridii]
MVNVRFMALAGTAAIVLAACAQPPQPQAARAVPLYAKSGAALCVPSEPLPGTNYPPDLVLCEEICAEDPVAGANVAICPPLVDRGRQRGVDDEDDDSSTQTGTRPTGQGTPTAGIP